MAQNNAAAAVQNIYRTPELWQKITFTFLCLVLYRTGSHITVPGVDVVALTDFFRNRGGGKPRFEGGQMPLTRRLPKRGFTNIFRVEHQVVRLNDLSRLPEGMEVTPETLVEVGLIHRRKGPAKVLANGEVTRAVTVRGVKMSAGARSKIEAAGGRVEE